MGFDWALLYRGLQIAPEATGANEASLLLVFKLSGLFRKCLVSFKRFAPCSEILQFLSSSLLLVFATGLLLVLNSLVRLERFDSVVLKIFSLHSVFRSVCSFF